MPRSRSRRSGAPESTKGGAAFLRRAKAVSDSWRVKQGEPRCRAATRCRQRDSRRRRAQPRSRSERGGAPKSARDGAPATNQGFFRQLARAARRADMPRSHELRTARRRRAPPRSQGKGSGVPALIRRGAPATSQSCFRQQARAARRADMPRSHELRTARRRRAPPRSQSKRSGVTA